LRIFLGFLHFQRWNPGIATKRPAKRACLTGFSVPSISTRRSHPRFAGAHSRNFIQAFAMLIELPEDCGPGIFDGDDARVADAQVSGQVYEKESARHHRSLERKLLRRRFPRAPDHVTRLCRTKRHEGAFLKSGRVLIGFAHGGSLTGRRRTIQFKETFEAIAFRNSDDSSTCGHMSHRCASCAATQQALPPCHPNPVRENPKYRFLQRPKSIINSTVGQGFGERQETIPQIQIQEQLRPFLRLVRNL
jgi:hypothetical protein